MNATSNPDPEKLGTGAYVIGGMSFIPLIGVVFGIAAIAIGLSTGKPGGKRLAAIGAAGIACTIVLYGSLFYFGFVQRGGIYDHLRDELAQTEINSLVQSIEFYKVQNGKYPDSLEALRQSLPKDSFVQVFDPSDMRMSGRSRYFFYQRVGDDHYYLRGVGADGTPFTADDVVPQIPVTQGSKLGLLIERKTP